MTPQERELLTTFLQQLAQTKADPKDPQADAIIRDATSRQPDAGYLLVQRAMGLDLALQAAQIELAKLQAEREPARAGAPSAFLGSTNSWGRSSAPVTPTPATPIPATSGATSARPGAAGPAPASAWGSGMMANLATTAAGVVAGSFLYQGIQNLMGQRDTGAGKGDAAAAATNDPSTDEQIANALDDDASDYSAGSDDGGSDLA